MKMADEDVKKLNRSVNLVDLPGLSTDYRDAVRHRISLEIFDNDTYQIRIDGQDVYTEP